MKHEHVTYVVSTRRVRDLFRKRLWIYCRSCDLKFGPFWNQREVDQALFDMELLG